MNYGTPLCRGVVSLAGEELRNALKVMPLPRVLGVVVYEYVGFDEEANRISNDLVAEAGLSHLCLHNTYRNTFALDSLLESIVKMFYRRDRTPGALYRGLPCWGLQDATRLHFALSSYDLAPALELLRLGDRRKEVEGVLSLPETKKEGGWFSTKSKSRKEEHKELIDQIDKEEREIGGGSMNAHNTRSIRLMIDWYAWMGIEKLVEWKR